VKTTLEISDPIFRRAKAKAAKRGVPLHQFGIEAVTEKPGTKPSARREV
jgi:hypothetical protein